ncbi:hypothetical protein [Daejeonia sp. YH14]|uniref:hypothetical protein n=1 Tax=Daejeonia sp. YH14 TaxID=3439042 RepID=UPI003F4968EE
MLDKIHIIKKNLSNDEVCKILNKTNLQENQRNGKKYFDNALTKDFTGGIYIKIDHENNLKIVGSVHKYSNFLHTGLLDNYNTFNMQEARETVLKMLGNYGISLPSLQMYSYELGANIRTEITPAVILEKLADINGKRFYYNSIYKHESVKTTDLHRDFRVVYKVYDKKREMIDKKRKPPDILENIIRIETQYRRIQMDLNRFLSVENLTKIQDKFFRDFNNIHFLPNILNMEKARQNQIEIARNIIIYGIEKTAEIYRERHNTGETSYKQYRQQKQFIKNWFEKELFKKFKPTPPEFFPIWAKLLNSEFQILKENFLTQ